MGILSLNTFINEECFTMKRISGFEILKNKKVCIDIYNFIYEYLADNRLIENIEKLCKLLNKYNIQTLFVFDGKYSDMKITTHNNRKTKRKLADIRYNKMLKKRNLSVRERRVLERVKRQRVKITKWDIHDAKRCIELCGMKYIIASGEAEEFCCELVRKKKVYACMSNDTDLFAYGCKKIIRNVDLKNELFNEYDYDDFLNFIDMRDKEFKMLCVMSSNDYNNKEKKFNFRYYYTLFKKYMETMQDTKVHEESKENMGSFIEWLLENEYLTEENFEKYENLKDVFELSKKNVSKNNKYILIRNGEMDYRGIKNLCLERKRYLAELY